MADLLDALWAPDGLHCLVSITGGVPRHHWIDDPKTFDAQALAASQPLAEWYFAPATYRERKRRQDMVLNAKAFWLDIDVGAGKAYPTLPAAAEALRDFIHAAQLPIPWVIQSGRGMHAYWTLTSPIVPPLWKPVAERLKQACLKASFAVGPERTADSASIMRLPGTWHRKDPAHPLPVRVLKEGPLVDFLVFSRALERYAPSTKMAVPSLTRSVNESMMAMTTTRTPSSAPAIAQRCQQMAHFQAAGGSVPEPFWYAAIQLLRFTQEAPEVVHRWSQGDPRYDRAQTDEKLAQLETKGIGPTTCERMSAVSGQADICLRCPFWKKITTPLVLGAQVTHEVAPTEPGSIALPAPFFHDDQGRIGVRNPSTHVDEIIYPYPIKIVRRLADEGQEYIEFQCKFPRDGWQTLLLPLASLYSRTGIAEELAARGVLLDTQYVDTMATFLVEAARTLQQNEAVCSLIGQLGWQRDGSFVDGAGHYNAEGPLRTPTVAPGIVGVTRGFTPAPNSRVDEWDVVFEHYEDAPVAWQVAFLAAFAAPLMRFTGYGGVTVNLLGQTGTGKSTVQRVGAAIYGDPNALMGQKHDTVNSLMQRLGVYHSLPLCVDEMTNIESTSISDFVYQVSQGRERSRLSSDAIMRPDRTWNTIVMSSSNASLSARLGSAKMDTRAEQARIWEMHMPSYATQGELEDVNHCAQGHYGLIGPHWVRYLAAHSEQVQTLVSATTTHIRSHWGVATHERYWQTFAVVILSAAKLLDKMDLAHFSTHTLSTFLREHIKSHRSRMAATTETSVDVLGMFLNDTLRERVLLTYAPRGSARQQLPPGLQAISLRYEAYDDALYISEHRLRAWVEEKRAATLSEIWESWQQMGYRPHRMKKSLGEGFEGVWSHTTVIRLFVPEKALRVVPPPVPATARTSQAPGE